ncbi:MAG: AraC family transcriptional regulator, partial [Opitutae bacterium]|nr:AraC family transcriptional regulator [Opitutae bacterium]
MRARFEKVPSVADRSFYLREQRLARFDAPWHFHPEIELTLVAEGRGQRFVGNSIEPFAEGDLVLLGSNLPHFWHSEGRPAHAGRAHSVVVQFRPDFLGGELWTRPEFAAIRRLLQRAQRGLHFIGLPARAAAQRLRALGVQRGCQAVLELLAILDLLAAARRVRPLASEAYEPSLDRHAEKRLARVYGFLMEHYLEPLTLAEIARVAAMTPAGFSRYFKRVTGRNVSDFLNELRVNHAAQL